MVTALVAGAAAGIGALSERYGWTWFPNYKDVNALALGNDEQMEDIAFERAKTLLIQEEGIRAVAYYDTRGFLTVGIGHKVLPSDGISPGDSISKTRIDQFFANDINLAFNAAKSQAKQIERYNADMIARLTSVNFQLGTGWTSKFPNTWALLRQGKGQSAANNILSSLWAQQTPNRAANFAIEIKNQFA